MGGVGITTGMKKVLALATKARSAWAGSGNTLSDDKKRDRVESKTSAGGTSTVVVATTASTRKKHANACASVPTSRRDPAPKKSRRDR